MNPRTEGRRRSKADCEAILLRPCPHEWSKGKDYCRDCSQIVSWRAYADRLHAGVPRRRRGPRRPKAEVEAALGRPCPHLESVGQPYCAKCSSVLYHRNYSAARYARLKGASK
jgi:hypothetical protein